MTTSLVAVSNGHGRLVRSVVTTSHHLAPGRHVMPRSVIVVPRDPRGVLLYVHGSRTPDSSEGERLLGAACAEGRVVLVCPVSVGARWDLRAGRAQGDLAAVSALLDTVLGQVSLTGGVVGLAGFGDGASFALALGLANGDVIDAVIAFAPGFARPPQHIGRPAVLLAHGADDTVLPIACSRQIVAGLEARALTASLVEFPGGHEVPSWVASTAVEWLLRR